MRKGANIFLIIGAVVALSALFPIASLATDGGDPGEPAKQAGEDRWVPSLAIIGGTTIQQQEGFASSLCQGAPPPLGGDCISPSPVPLRGSIDGDDLAVSPFVGGALELMTPALPIPTRPRLFISGEILPTFASDRDLAIEGDPGCIRGEKPGAPCANDGGDPFGEDEANGEGSRTSAQVDTLVYGASVGVAFPLQFGKRQLRIKPSFGWLNYKVEADGLVVDAACNDPTDPDPPGDCVIVRDVNDDITKQSLRERTLTASGSQRFNGIGPGLDIEMDTGRYGPIGSSLFLGARAYRILGNRSISFGTEESFGVQYIDPNDSTSPIAFGPETDVAAFEVEVDPWIYRAHVGIRLYWLGSRK